MKSKIGLMALAIVLFLLAIGATAFVWWQTQQQQRLSAAQWQTLQAQVEQGQSSLAHTQDELAKWVRHSQQSADQQTLSDVAYLINRAHLYLQMDDKVDNAVQALNLAQTTLKTINNPQLSSLQNSLESDIKQLKNTTIPNEADIQIQLQSLASAIKELSWLPELADKQADAEKAIDPNQPWYRQAYHKAMAQLKDIVIIRYHHQNIPTTLSPNQRQLLRENITLALQQAQWAVLQENADFYQHSLKQVQQWVLDHYTDNAARAQVLQQLSALSAINIAPVMPNIDATERALQAVQEQAQAPQQPQKTTQTMTPETVKEPTENATTQTPKKAVGVEI